jgi:hypothetical protein
VPIETYNLKELRNNEEFILKFTGIPEVFLDLLKKSSVENDVAFAIRAGAAFQRYQMPNAPKPVTVKAKTGNWGAAKGVIPEDNALGKVENHDGKMVVKHRDDHKDLPTLPGIIEPVLHKLSLREVVDGLERGDFELASNKNGRLVFKATDGPTDANIEFSIDLRESQRVDKQLNIPDIDKITKNLAEVSQPDWWRQEMGDFHQLVDNYYPAQYRDANQPESKFADINVFGVPSGEGEAKVVLPITGDQDSLWITRPATAENLKEPPRVYNTFKQGEVEDLVGARFDMAMAEAGDDMEKLEQLINIDKGSIARLGCVTAFESKIIDGINTNFQAVVKHMLDLFQHGTENHNPGTPSPLDSPMVHVWRGQAAITHTEKELVEYVLQPGYLEANIVDIHPKWDMNKWAPVIEKQVQLGHPVPIATLAACVEHKLGLQQPLPEKMLELYIKTGLDNPVIAPKPAAMSSTAMMAGMLGGANAKKILTAASSNMDSHEKLSEGQTAISKGPQPSITTVEPKEGNDNTPSPSSTKRFR